MRISEKEEAKDWVRKQIKILPLEMDCESKNICEF